MYFHKKFIISRYINIYHCNGADIFIIYERILPFAEKYNINILIPEYPGYSIYNKAQRSSETVLKNCLIIYDFLLENIKGLQEKNIFLLGRSLGTCPTIYTASKKTQVEFF